MMTDFLVSFSSLDTTEPPSYPFILKTTGNIASAAYGLWLNDIRCDGGEVTFGAVNSDKYTGILNTFDVVSEDDGIYQELRINLATVAFTNPDGSDMPLLGGTLNVPAVIDSGTTFMLLPSNLVNSIISALGGSWENGRPSVPCSKIH